jgi:hypothetical protein
MEKIIYIIATLFLLVVFCSAVCFYKDAKNKAYNVTAIESVSEGR